jgi:hypothetical protein
VSYLLCPYILILFSPGSKQGGAAGLKNMIYPDNFSLALAVLATLPAVCFIYSWIRRSPGASNSVTLIWRNGAVLLTMTAFFNIAIVFVPLLMGVEHKLNHMAWVQLCVPVLIIAYVNDSRRVKETFADFPGGDEVAQA